MIAIREPPNVCLYRFVSSYMQVWAIFFQKQLARKDCFRIRLQRYAALYYLKASEDQSESFSKHA